MKRVILIGLCAAAYFVYEPRSALALLVVFFCFLYSVFWLFGKIFAMGNRDAARLRSSGGGGSSTDNAIQRSLDQQARDRGNSF